MAAPKIFVSHSHKDDVFTGRLVADLRQAGADAWMDITDLGAGNFQQRISVALGECEWFVMVLTRDALASPWVQQEVDAANLLKHSGKIRDLIFLQAGPLDYQELPALWRVFNIFDATADYISARDRALKALGLAPATVIPQRVPPQAQVQAQQGVGMIVIRQGKEPGRVFELRKDRLTIGRGRICDIPLEDDWISYLHATLNSDGNGHYIIRDNRSIEGTYVNQQRITERVLEEGDEIQVGKTVLAFVRANTK